MKPYLDEPVDQAIEDYFEIYKKLDGKKKLEETNCWICATLAVASAIHRLAEGK
jgi:hypothetical protein